MITCVFFLARRRWVAAGVAIGVGFALKLTPIVLLPLALMAAGERKGRLRTLAAATVAAVLPFVPFVVHAPASLIHGFLGYQGQRPLQIESVLATPYLVARALGHVALAVVVPDGGSVTITDPGTGALAAASPWLLLAALLFVYWLVWRCRQRLQADPQSLVPIAFTVVLVTLCCNKVLSPQHLLWLLPLAALTLAGNDRLQRAAAALVFLAVVLTQVEYPAMYNDIVVESIALGIVSARNVLLVGAAMLAVLSLSRMPQPRTGDRHPGGRRVR